MATTMGSQQVYELQQIGLEQQQLTFRSRSSAAAQDQPHSRRQSVDLRQLPLAARLSCIPNALAARQEGLALVQAYYYGKSDRGRYQAKFRRQETRHCLLALNYALVHHSCEGGIPRSAIGMLGKVWSSGALAVVQNVAIIPTSVHPRNKLDDNMSERVSELAYIPVHDLRQPEAGVVACLEVMMSSFATSALVANVISHTCDLLTQFQLSLGKPATSPPAVAPSPSPFAAAAGQQLSAPGHFLARNSMDCTRPLPPAHLFARASMGCPRAAPPLPPLERHPTAPPVHSPSPYSCYSGTGGAYSNCGSYSSTGSGPDSPGTPSAVPPMLRQMSMQRTASIRRLDSLADMAIG